MKHAEKLIHDVLKSAFSFDEFHKNEKQKGEPDIVGDEHNWAVHNKWEAYMKSQKSNIKSAEDYKKISDEYWEKLFEKAK